VHLSPNRPKWASTWPTSPRISIGCAQNDFRAYCTFGTNRALILCADQHYLQMEQNELTLTHVTKEVHRVRPKKFPCPWYIWRKPCSYLEPTLTRLQVDQSKLSLDPRHLGVQLGAPKMISEPIARSAQTGHLSCIEISIISKETKTSFHLTHVT
jgi:hypothetical protein